jgi:hypothetical protein
MTHRAFGTDDITCRYEGADPISKLVFSKKKTNTVARSVSNIWGKKVET